MNLMYLAYGGFRHLGERREWGLSRIFILLAGIWDTTILRF